jgi:hypothetical protein
MQSSKSWGLQGVEWQGAFFRKRSEGAGRLWTIKVIGHVAHSRVARRCVERHVKASKASQEQGQPSVCLLLNPRSRNTPRRGWQFLHAQPASGGVWSAIVEGRSRQPGSPLNIYGRAAPQKLAQHSPRVLIMCACRFIDTLTENYRQFCCAESSSCRPMPVVQVFHRVGSSLQWCAGASSYFCFSLHHSVSGPVVSK